MKFHSFNLMPYPYLPDDFTEKHRSVWVDVPASLYDPVRGHRLYHDYLDQLVLADKLGFDGICVNEHHQNAYGLMPSPNLMASILARSTERAAVVVMGDSVALYNPPIRVAEEMAMLDVLSGGRLVAGFPVGTAMDSTFCYGQTPATLRDKFQEGVELVLRAWSSEEPFSFNGKYTQLRYVNPWPRPIQAPRPPVWVPGSRSVETWAWCIENDFLYANLSYFGYAAGKPVMEGFWQTADEMGVERNPYRAGFLLFVAVADSDAEAEELYAEHALYFYNRCLHVDPGFTNPPGYATIETLRRGVASQVEAATKAKAAELTWKDILDRGYVIAGSPSTVAEQLREAATGLHVGHLMVLLHFGSMPTEVATRNITQFARDVMPNLRPQFDEWEDHWSPSVVDVTAPPEREVQGARA